MLSMSVRIFSRRIKSINHRIGLVGRRAISSTGPWPTQARAKNSTTGILRELKCGRKKTWTLKKFRTLTLTNSCMAIGRTIAISRPVRYLHRPGTPWLLIKGWKLKITSSTTREESLGTSDTSLQVQITTCSPTIELVFTSNRSMTPTTTLSHSREEQCILVRVDQFYQMMRSTSLSLLDSINSSRLSCTHTSKDSILKEIW